MEHNKKIQLVICILLVMKTLAGPGNSINYGANEKYIFLNDVSDSIIQKILILSFVDDKDSIDIISTDTNICYSIYKYQRFITKRYRVKTKFEESFELYVASTLRINYWTFWKREYESVAICFSFFYDSKGEIIKRCKSYTEQFVAFLSNTGVTYKKVYR